MEHTQTHKLAYSSRVDMNMITQLRFDYAVALCLRTRCSNATAIDNSYEGTAALELHKYQDSLGATLCYQRVKAKDAALFLLQRENVAVGWRLLAEV